MDPVFPMSPADAPDPPPRSPSPEQNNNWSTFTQRPTATQPIPIRHPAHTFERIEAIFI